MEELTFFTQEIYENPELIIGILNDYIRNNQIKEKEFYESGEVLCLDVYDNEVNRASLSKVISDIEAFKEYSKNNYLGYRKDCLDMAALIDTYNYLLEDRLHRIYWSFDIERFIFLEDYIID